MSSIIVNGLEQKILQDEKVLYSHRLTGYKASKFILIFFCVISVLAADMCFLALGVVGAVFKDFKWLSVGLFVVKIFLDCALFSAWVFSVKDKVNKEKATTIYVTETKVYLIKNVLGEVTAVCHEKNNIVVKEKTTLLQKFFGVFTITLASGDLYSVCRFASGDYKQILLKVLSNN